MFLDIGIGIIAGIFFQVNVEFSWYFFAFTLIAALLPDMDMFWYWLRKKTSTSVLDNHRSFTHYPIIYLPVTILIYLYFGTHIATVFALLILYHFVHDTFFIGWGVKWVWPFTERAFKIFPDQNGKVTSRFVLSWLPEQDEEIKKWAGESDWIKAFYKTPNIVAYIEYPVFLFSLYYLFITLA